MCAFRKKEGRLAHPMSIGMYAPAGHLYNSDVSRQINGGLGTVQRDEYHLREFRISLPARLRLLVDRQIPHFFIAEGKQLATVDSQIKSAIPTRLGLTKLRVAEYADLNIP